MEILVSLAVFSISVGLIADIFLTASRRQARTTATVRLQGDARLLLATIARELREGTIDHAQTTAALLALRDADGNLVQFDQVTDGCAPGVASCVRIGRGRVGEPVAFAAITGGATTVEAFDVRAAPPQDPFVWDAAREEYGSDEQPRVTVFLRLAQVAAGSGGPITVEAQTTVVSRAYRR